MAIRVVKGKSTTNLNIPPPNVNRPTPRLTPRPTPTPRLTPAGTSGVQRKKSRAPLLAVAIVGGLFVIILGICLSNGRSTTQAPRPVAQPQPSRAERPYEPRRLAELGGLTMAEWEAKHNTNNAMLEARKQRMRNYGAGR